MGNRPEGIGSRVRCNLPCVKTIPGAAAEYEIMPDRCISSRFRTRPRRVLKPPNSGTRLRHVLPRIPCMRPQRASNFPAKPAEFPAPLLREFGRSNCCFPPLLTSQNDSTGPDSKKFPVFSLLSREFKQGSPSPPPPTPQPLSPCGGRLATGARRGR